MSAKSKKYKHDKNPAKEMIEIYQDTIEHFKDQISTPGILIDITELEIDLKADQDNKYQIEVKNIDTLDLALKYLELGLNPLILNMASAVTPGGGVTQGKSAQEECLFRRSNAHLTHLKEYYPLTVDQAIYSPEITILKDSNYQLLPNKQRQKAAMFTVSAIKNPKLINNKYKKSDREIMTKKIEAMFLVAIKYQHDSLVLGAFGCGIFNNPVDLVIDIFQQSIEKYGHFFKQIGFAVLAVGRNGKENYQRFKKAL